MFEKSRNIWLLGVSALDVLNDYIWQTPLAEKNVVLSVNLYKTNSKYYEILTI